MLDVLREKFRDPDRAGALAETIRAAVRPERRYALMEFCGGHTHALAEAGLETVLPANVEMVHGPGCPVCVLPASAIDMAVTLAGRPDIILCTYADMIRVPGTRGRSLVRARADGADIRPVYSTVECLDLARRVPGKEIVFFAIGFETTTPPTAFALEQAARENLTNFSVLCRHVLTPAAIRAVLQPADGRAPNIDGIVGPGHVSTVTGTRAFDDVARYFAKPIVVSGFEPVDLLAAILLLIRQINDGRAGVENAYRRAAGRTGNDKAARAIGNCFRPVAAEWRGLGEIAASGLAVSDTYADYDAERKFAADLAAAPVSGRENAACACGNVLRGLVKPADCSLFGAGCTPASPMGPCMVSSEGACAAEWRYGGRNFSENAG